MKTLIIIQLAAVVACGCFDVNLLDEMQIEGTPDGGSSTDESGGSGDVEDTGSDGDDPGDPPDTDPNDSDPPVLVSLSCSSGEREQDNVCIAEGPGSASLRFATDEQADITTDVEADYSSSVLSLPWLVEHHIVVGQLAQEIETAVSISLADVNGNNSEFDSLVTSLAGPQVVVSEILADPLGSEPDQEFIEIINLGPEAIDLSDWMIDDNGDFNGDLIPQGTTVGPSQVAVLVSPNYNINSTEDPSPSSSALTIFLDSSLCSNGLKNSEAESIELYDSLGNLVSTFNSNINPVEGQGTTRIVAEAPDDDPLAFQLDPAGTSTPGDVPTL